jgi:glycosyltransferase involved in cell wall biosynthesis
VVLNSSPPALKILHVLRAPVGGLFRHVLDVADGQIMRGHAVGIVADSLTGGSFAETLFRRVEGKLALGLHRFPMQRGIGLGDVEAVRHVRRIVNDVGPDIVHGHGSKGGAYGRLASRAHRAVKVYTPHGGTLHFRPRSPAGLAYTAIERFLARSTDLFLFESAYAEKAFRTRIDTRKALSRVAQNGLNESEFEPVLHADDAADILFIGELRDIKGVDVLLDALAQLRASGMPLTACIVGDGPDRDALKARAATLNLTSSIWFHAPMPARQAFALGRLAVVPSRAESLPYIVLEYAAAGMPMIATRVGGLPDVFGPQSESLLPPGDMAALVRAIGGAINDPETMLTRAQTLQARVRAEFSAEKMIEAGLSAYVEALAVKKLR